MKTIENYSFLISGFKKNEDVCADDVHLYKSNDVSMSRQLSKPF